MKSFHRTPFVPALIVILSLIGCSSLNIDREWDRSVDFSAYSTYAWIPQDEGPVHEQQLPEHLDIRLRRVVDDIMMDQKGFERAPAPPQADLLLAYYVDLKKQLKVDYTLYGGYYGGYGYGYWPGYGPGYGGPGYGGGGAVSKVREYATGSLVLDIVDRRTKQLVWTGIVQGDAKYDNPSGARVEDVMTKMLKDFPPPTK